MNGGRQVKEGFSSLETIEMDWIVYVIQRVNVQHWLQVIYKSMLGKAPPYLSSLVTITTPTRSTHSSRYIALIIPKANTSFGHLSFQFSAASAWNEW